MNAFAKIAKPTSAAAKKSSVRPAEVTEVIKTAVDRFVANKADLKRLESEQVELETAIIDHVRPQQDAFAYSGEFTKSLSVAGSKATVTYVTADKFSVPQDEETLTEVKKVIGPKTYDEFFESKSTISLKKEVTTDEKILNKIAAACEKAGLPIGDIFDNVTKIIAKDDLDQKQYDLPKEKLPLFRALIRQAKPALK